MIRFAIDPIVIALVYAGFSLAVAALGLYIWSLKQAPTQLRVLVFLLCATLSTGAIIQSGATSDLWTIDPTSKAGRVTEYDTAGRPVYPAAVYSISSLFTPAATPNNLVIIEGSSTKTVKVISMWMCTQTTAAGSVEFFLKKYSSVATGGTFVSAGTPVPMDAADAAATPNRVGHFTADPTPGTLLGKIRALSFATPAPRPATPAGIVELSCVDLITGSQGGVTGPLRTVTLRGVSQYLAVDFNDVALVAGQIHQYTITWAEE